MTNAPAKAEPAGEVDRFAAGPMLLALEGKGNFPEVDTESMRVRMNAQLLEATSPDELLASGRSESLEGLLDRPLEVRAAVPRPSKLKGEGLAGFLILDLTTLDDGVDHIVTTSAENVAVRVAIASDRGWLPIRFKVRKAEAATERGFFPLIVESL